ncbi:MAG: ABC transporter ATP-binding protein [Candidatus Omnitrophota bacterium]
MSVLLEVNNLSGGYDKGLIIKDISFKIRSGDFLGIIGPNGSGKTTLFRLLSRVLIPKTGTINFDSKNIFKMALKEFCQKTAYCLQNTELNFPFTVLEFVLLGRIPHMKRFEFESKDDIEVAQDSLSLTGSLMLRHKMIDELSSGERQRVFISKALAQCPQLLFLDEPTSHLDIGHQIQILNLLKKLNKENNLTIVLILHDLNLASLYCNRIILLNEGKIFKEGTAEEVLTYQNIEAVYKTVVVVNKHPFSAKPYVFLSGKER